MTRREASNMDGDDKEKIQASTDSESDELIGSAHEDQDKKTQPMGLAEVFAPFFNSTSSTFSKMEFEETFNKLGIFLIDRFEIHKKKYEDDKEKLKTLDKKLVDLTDIHFIKEIDSFLKTQSPQNITQLQIYLQLRIYEDEIISKINTASHENMSRKEKKKLLIKRKVIYAIKIFNDYLESRLIKEEKEEVENNSVQDKKLAQLEKIKLDLINKPIKKMTTLEHLPHIAKPFDYRHEMIQSIIKNKYVYESYNHGKIQCFDLNRGIILETHNEVYHIPGTIRLIYQNHTLVHVEASNSALLDLLSTQDKNWYARTTLSPDPSNISDDERENEMNEYLTKIAHKAKKEEQKAREKAQVRKEEQKVREEERKARVEEFVNYEFDDFVNDLKTELTQYRSSKYYIMYNEIKDSKTEITYLPTEFNSFEEAFNARPESDKHTYYIVELNNQTPIVDFKNALVAVKKNSVSVYQNSIMLNNLLHNESPENLPESLNRFYKIDRNESTLDPNKIVYNPNSSVIARFEKAIHEISLKENDLKDSILLKLFSKDDIINSKLIALQELKKELKDKLAEIKNQNNQNSPAKDISVASVVEAFEKKDKENAEAINKHRFFSSSKPSVTRKLVDHLKTDPEYKLTKK